MPRDSKQALAMRSSTLRAAAVAALGALVWISSSSSFLAPPSASPRRSSWQSQAALPGPAAAEAKSTTGAALGAAALLVGALFSVSRRRDCERTRLFYKQHFDIFRKPGQRTGYEGQFSADKSKKGWYIPEARPIPVWDMDGNMIGEETAQFRTFSKETANYAVDFVMKIWLYQQKKWLEWWPRRQDRPKGKKLWKNKGVGKARMKSVWSTRFGKTSTNKNPYGDVGKGIKHIPRGNHFRAISTVLQSKWKRMRIVDRLEDWEEPKYYKFCQMLRNVTGIYEGKKDTLIIARRAHGRKSQRRGYLDEYSFDSPLFLAGRLIPKITFRRPMDIDPDKDGLNALLQARRVIMSREAFHDLKAKYDARTGWAFKDSNSIYVKQLQELVQEYPYSKQDDYEAARLLGPTIPLREEWAKTMREQEAADAVA